MAAARTRPRPQRRAARTHGRVPQAHRGDDDRTIERADHLRNAIRLYHEAYRTTNKAYHELNWRQLVAIARLNGITVDDEPAAESVDEPGAHALPPEDASPPDEPSVSEAETASNFWQRAGVGDRLLTTILTDAPPAALTGVESEQTVSPAHLADDFAALERAYEAAFRLRSNPRERASVTEHLRDLVDLAPPDGPLATALTDARDRLDRWQNRESPPGE